MNGAYKDLYGYPPLSQKPLDQHVNKYLPILDVRMVTLVVDADEQLVAGGQTMYSLVEALP